MDSGRPKKICVVCGEDCSSRKRTKDAKGNYFCTPCYEQRVEALRAGQAMSLVPEMELPPSAITDDSPFELDPNLIEIESTGVQGPLACSSCGTGVQPGAIICLNCGSNLQSGSQVRTHFQSDTYAPPRGSGTIWPIVIGVLSIAFGGVGVLFYAFRLAVAGSDLGSFDTGQDSAYAAGVTTGYLIGSILPLLLSLWLTIAGIGVTMRRPGAVRWMRGWAITKTVLCCIGGTCLGIGLMMASSSGQVPTQLGGQGTIGMAWMIVIFGVAWVLFWPVFVLIWFGRAKVQNDIERW